MPSDPNLSLFLNGAFDRAQKEAELARLLQVSPRIRDARIATETAEARRLAVMPEELSSARTVHDRITHFVELGHIQGVCANRARDPKAVMEMRRDETGTLLFARKATGTDTP